MPSSPLLITTTRHTTPRTRSLIKELSFSLDNAIKVIPEALKDTYRKIIKYANYIEE